MKDRIAKIIDAKNLNSAKFADTLNVNRASISHILNGRNNPSLEIVLKILTTFKNINPQWLLFGEGEMFTSPESPKLFDDSFFLSSDIEPDKNFHKIKEDTSFQNKPSEIIPSSNFNSETKEIEKIVILFKDKTFREYVPS